MFCFETCTENETLTVSVRTDIFCQRLTVSDTAASFVIGLNGKVKAWVASFAVEIAGRNYFHLAANSHHFGIYL